MTRRRSAVPVMPDLAHRLRTTRAERDDTGCLVTTRSPSAVSPTTSTPDGPHQVSRVVAADVLGRPIQPWETVKATCGNPRCLEHLEVGEYIDHSTHGGGADREACPECNPSPGAMTVEERVERQRVYAKRYQAKNMEMLKIKEKRWKKNVQQQVDVLKEASPCLDCGRYFPAVCMDYDHINDDKTMSVSQTITHGWAFKRVLTEIAKCDLVCSNCHRIRTDIRRLRTSRTDLITKIGDELGVDLMLAADCEMEDKVELIRQVAELVGVDVDEVFGSRYQ